MTGPLGSIVQSRRCGLDGTLRRAIHPTLDRFRPRTAAAISSGDLRLQGASLGQRAYARYAK
jgi:hypothetical protein